MIVNPSSLIQEKVSWPKPGLNKKNNQTVRVLIYSMMPLAVAEVCFVTVTPKPLYIRAANTNSPPYRARMGLETN